MAHTVQDHYRAPDLVARILSAIPWAPGGDTSLNAAQLYPFDQLHGRELLATKDHASRLSPPAGAHILDIGSGVGGPARYFATNFGSRVTGIDITPDFVATATELTRLCGLDHLVTFIEANAGALPFDTDIFDHAYSFYVGMNLAHKATVLSECIRVLKPGGRLLWTEVTAVAGVAHYPLPWSRRPEDSHVLTRPALTEHFTTAGFEVLSTEDETGAHLELAQKMKLSGRTPSAGQTQVNAIVLGPDFAERRTNYIKSLADGLIQSTLLDVRKPT
jgi:ubiquinone/menaquinone biosynthesis C-methylase UbiE